MRAYHEWMPTRSPPPLLCASGGGASGGTGCSGTHEGEDMYRLFDFGALARLYVLETRLLNRSHQVIGLVLVRWCVALVLVRFMVCSVCNVK